MKLLFKQATILDTSSKYHLTQQDILIEDGIFLNIAPAIHEPVDVVIEEKDLYVSTGFVDVFAHFNDPGLEQKETLLTGALAAQKGGYTSVIIVPNTQPTIDNKASVEYIVQNSKNLPVQVLPIGAISSNTEGKHLAEMIEMQQSGAVAFSDGKNAIQNAGLLLKALQYVKKFNGTILQLPYDASLTKNGLVNEGIQSTQLGLPGIPAIAEEIQVARDIELCTYTDSHLHITGISTAKSITLIAAAKAKQVKVTCSVTPYHLLLTDAELEGYNTNAKVYPPLRSINDTLALQKALQDGTIDCIASHHHPHEVDAKQCEFSQAQFGMSTIETTIAIGNTCAITAFTMYPKNTISTQQFLSKGKNSAFIGKELSGSIIATINKKHHYLAR
jgi:dihydroorotase